MNISVQPMHGHHTIVTDAHVARGTLVRALCALMLDTARYANSSFPKIDDVVLPRSFKMLCNTLFANIEGTLVTEPSRATRLATYCASQGKLGLIKL